MSGPHRDQALYGDFLLPHPDHGVKLFILIRHKLSHRFHSGVADLKIFKVGQHIMPQNWQVLFPGLSWRRLGLMRSGSHTGRDHWILMTLARSALSHATLQSSSSSWRGGAPALIITSVIISASISPTLLPRVTSSKLMQQHARGEHRPSPGARPSYIRASERTVSTQAAAAESGPWRQPFLAEYAQYLGQDSLCSTQKSTLSSKCRKM